MVVVCLEDWSLTYNINAMEVFSNDPTRDHLFYKAAMSLDGNFI